MTHRFTIEGPLWGYAQGRREAHRPERVAFKERIRYEANLAGVPAEPTEATTFRVEIHWRKRARIDGKNVYALVEDALWKQDRDVAAGSWRRYLNRGREYVIVTVEVPRMTRLGEIRDDAE